MADNISFNALRELILEAQKKVPAVKFALGVAAVAAAGAIVIAALGNSRIGMIVLGGVFVAMILLFVFSRLVSSRSRSIMLAGIVLLWTVIIFFCTFLVFTTTAFAFRWPDAWVRFIGIHEAKPSRETILRDFEIPSNLLGALAQLKDKPNAGLVRLHPLQADRPASALRETVYKGGGAYYSFVRQTHEYGHGSDIKYEGGFLSVGFAGANYGFFLLLGEPNLADFSTIDRKAPAWLSINRKAAWDFMWDYRPPTEIKQISEEQKKARGFVVNGTNLSERVRSSVGGSYLLRSVNIRESDVLVAVHHVNTLNDGSIVLAYKIVAQFDTPISTGREE